MKHLMILLMVTACNATGQEWNDNIKGNLVIYRPSHAMYSLRDYTIQTGDKSCKLANGGFFVTNIAKESVVNATMWDSPGTTTLTTKPGYVKIELNEQRGWAGVFGSVGGGWAGSIASQSVSSGNGPFIITNVPESQAKQELKGLRRDCN